MISLTAFGIMVGICFGRILHLDIDEAIRLISETKTNIYKRFNLERVDQQQFFLGIANMDLYVSILCYTCFVH